MKKVRAFVGLVMTLVCVCTQAASLRVVDPRCGNQACPSVVDTSCPDFSWKLLFDGKGVSQSAYRILVSDSESELRKGKGNLWDSGRVESDQSLYIKYAGRPLESGKEYYWKVMAWADDGSRSLWSEAGRIRAALLDPSDWGKARWIALEEMPERYRQVPGYQLAGNKVNYLDREAMMPQFRKEFDLKGKKVKSAVMSISGLGHFELTVNGTKVGDHLLDPGWTKYDKTALFLTFDVTDMLGKGKNALGVRLGNGFLHIPRDSTRYRKLISTYSFPKMICKLRITYADGSVEDVDSDSSWKVTRSPLTFSSIYGGEDFDATADAAGWDMPGSDDSSWLNAREVGCEGRLKAQMSPSITVRERFAPKKIFEAKPGVFIYDFGQNASAIVDLKVKGPRGAKVTMRPAEYLTDDSLANQNNSGLNYWFSYRLAGDGEEQWSPSFSYYGFRYVQVEGAVPAGYANPSGLPVIEGLEMMHVSNSSAAAGKFHCSDSLFNGIRSLVDWSVRSNMSHVLTDCPHREKLGWLEVAHLMSHSIAYSYDIRRMYRKILDDMKDCQQPNGLVPNTAPEYAEFPHDFRDSPEWGSASVILPWFIYNWYGDPTALEECYGMMKAYVDYLTSRAENHIVKHGLGDWYDLGPAHPGYSQLTSRGLTPTALYYNDLRIMERTAALLGKDEDSRNYGALADEVRKAFNEKFFDKEKGYYDRGSQTANAIPLYLGLVEEENRKGCLDRIVSDIRGRGNAITSGDIGFSYLLRTLQKEGASDVIFDMNSQSEKPGYGYQLRQGATSLTESWSALRTASHNHCMLGHIMEWFYGGLGGIRPSDDSVAFKKFVIMPEPVGDITFADAEFDSPYGRISNSWRIEGDDFVDTVTVPVNTRASICLPASDASRITEGGKPLAGNRYVRLVGEKDGRQIIEVGSGTYEFRVRGFGK